jgi:5-methylcytosine-specific restriction protein A
MRAARICPQPGCPKLNCIEHRRRPFASATRSSTLYRTARWRRERIEHLQREPNCRVCGASANVVDHVVPHRGDPVVFWDRSNWQSLCTRDSNAKTGRETRGRAV